ncbi:MAG: hypothetical protein JW969_00485 [Spirochaetales bacterium]|nr:hypothetical protein [Spirochaetales bacterium]
METKNPLILYLKSGLNRTFSIVAILALAASFIFFTGVFKWVAAASIAGVYLVSSFILLFTRRGAKEIAGQKDQERNKQMLLKIEHYGMVRNTIARLRIGDEKVRKSLEYFLLISGNYLNKCRELITYSPLANKKIDDVQELCQIYLEELDENSTEKRYGVEDGENVDDFIQRTVNGIVEASHFIKEKISGELVGLTKEEQLQIIEEMGRDSD